VRNVLDAFLALVPDLARFDSHPALSSLLHTCPRALLDALKQGLGVHYSGCCDKVGGPNSGSRVSTAYFAAGGNLGSLELPHIVGMLALIEERRDPDATRKQLTHKDVTLTLNRIADALGFRWATQAGQPGPRFTLAFYQVGRTGIGHDMRGLPVRITRAADDTFMNSQEVRSKWYFTKESFPFFLGAHHFSAAVSSRDTNVLTDLAFPHDPTLSSFFKDRLHCSAFDCSRLMSSEPLEDREAALLDLFNFITTPPLLCHTDFPHQAESLLVLFHAGANLTRSVLQPQRTHLTRYLHHWQHRDLHRYIDERDELRVRIPSQPASPPLLLPSAATWACGSVPPLLC
jgi:hypothetical protein